ncbi:hypothetical protein [Segetibacter sp.]|jgi:hypothetical protein|uniref:hypothetical protein n=1 Tax=Segetibacter sp. TaxID=2231182 RepID=UPI002618235C|nr:hypothetical protein [Segetibacter sp.]MCW3080111.1 hypothetical protein [Segetibacter sp.]
MSDLHNHTEKDSSLSTLILVAVVILGLMYFLAKGCTNSEAHNAPPAAHKELSIPPPHAL